MHHSLCILGCGGFIGSHLLDRILSGSRWNVIGVDRVGAKIAHHADNPRFTFVNLDISNPKPLRPLIAKSDAVISLVALCNPALYNTVPLEVIEANFARPREVVKMCAELDKWLIHFSTSEVYGKTAGAVTGNAEDIRPFSEDESPFILGPVSAQRWSYAAAKQLLERVIYAYGQEQKFKYTIVRPFNFIGPHMDFIPGIDGNGIPRVLACFMDALLFNKPIRLVDGGFNRRTFTFIDDAIDAIMLILDKPEKSAGQIFNIGNPSNDVSIGELARLMIKTYKKLVPEKAGLEFPVKAVSAEEFYGKGYEDSDVRIPDISKAKKLLGWEPRTNLIDALKVTMKAYIAEYGATEMVKAAG